MCDYSSKSCKDVSLKSQMSMPYQRKRLKTQQISKGLWKSAQSLMKIHLKFVEIFLVWIEMVKQLLVLLKIYIKGTLRNILSCLLDINIVSSDHIYITLFCIHVFLLKYFLQATNNNSHKYLLFFNNWKLKTLLKDRQCTIDFLVYC